MTLLTQRVDRLTDRVGALWGRDLERHAWERSSRVPLEDLDGVEIHDRHASAGSAYYDTAKGCWVAQVQVGELGATYLG